MSLSGIQFLSFARHSELDSESIFYPPLGKGGKGGFSFKIVIPNDSERARNHLISVILNYDFERARNREPSADSTKVYLVPLSGSTNQNFQYLVFSLL